MSAFKGCFIGMLEFLGCLFFALIIFLPLSASAQIQSPSPQKTSPKVDGKCVNSFKFKTNAWDNYLRITRSPRNKYYEVKFPQKVFSLEEMDVSKIKDLNELKKYGILNPVETNHKAGSNLILMTLSAVGPWKGEWTKAYGLLGVSMLNANLDDRNAYRSLFIHSPYGSKMHASLLGFRQNKFFLGSPSLIGRREYHIFRISSEFNWRYVHNNYAGSMKDLFWGGLEFYHDLKKKGYDDKILKSVLGMARASLSLKNEISFEENMKIRGLDPL
jgi:hypothetical protein